MTGKALLASLEFPEAMIKEVLKQMLDAGVILSEDGLLRLNEKNDSIQAV